ncbi:hypothetical protein ACFX1Q_013517 [Malus domestica]
MPPSRRLQLQSNIQTIITRKKIRSLQEQYEFPSSLFTVVVLESTGRKKATDHVPAVTKLKKSEMLGEGQFVHVKAERSLLVEVGGNSILKLCCCFQDK